MEERALIPGDIGQLMQLQKRVKQGMQQDDWLYPCEEEELSFILAGGGYGTAILSRFPIVSFEQTHFDVPAPREGRAVGHAVIDASGERVDVFNTHLSYESNELRAGQFAALADLVARTPAWVLTGDFNTANPAHFDVLGNASLANPNRYPTFPASSECIDNIVCASPWRITDTGTLQNHHSDHLLLWADLQKTSYERSTS